MILGQLYSITLGNYEDKYMCVSSGFMGFQFKRVRTPKTKIDGVRLPANIFIFKSYSVVGERQNPLKPAPTKSSKRNKKLKSK